MENHQSFVLPLVTIGMPVRNGDPYFEAALASVLAQDYPNLEIIVSDNGSTDNTPAVLARANVTDSRIRIFRQDKVLTAFDHFAWVMSQARGRYFMWAAHDDLRPAHYVSSLVEYLERKPKSVLAFADLRVSSIFGKDYQQKLFSFESEGVDRLTRMRKAASQQCYHIYGLWRTEVLRRIPFIYNGWWPDLPLMIAAASIGPFSRAEGVNFDYLEVRKTNEQRAQYQDNGRPVNRVFRVLKLFRVTFLTIKHVAGTKLAILATWFVLEKQLRVAFSLLSGKVNSGDR